MTFLRRLLSLIMLIALGVGISGTWVMKTSRYPILALHPTITVVRGHFQGQSEGEATAHTKATFFRLAEYPNAHFFIMATGMHFPLNPSDELEFSVSDKDANSLPRLISDREILAVGLSVNGQILVDAQQTLSRVEDMKRKICRIFFALTDIALVYYAGLIGLGVIRRSRDSFIP